MARILIIDDDKDICLLLEKFLTKKGFDVKSAQDGNSGEKLLKKESFDVVLCDYKLPDYSGLDVLKKIKIINHATQVIIITGYSDIKTAVETLRMGAFDYVTKPLYPEEILNTIQTALATDVKPKQVVKASSTTNQAGVLVEDYIVGDSQQALTAEKHIDLIAPTDMSVIISGETGTGKEYVAKRIHQKSKRAGRPFVAIDCGALPKELAGSELFGHVKGAFTGAINEKKGCFETANGGTLFLDEIGNLTYENQIKLLRVLQERKIKKIGGNKDIPVDVRVLVATNEELKKMVNEGKFREDIFHRLNEFRIELAPLRERTSDISKYAAQFLKEANQQLEKSVTGLDDEAVAIMESYAWHGNLRELKNVIKRAVLLSTDQTITASQLPDEISHPELYQNAANNNNVFDESGSFELKLVAEKAERIAILEVLKKTRNNKSKAADLLKIDRKTLYNKLSAYDIDV
ncbi:MAG: sigma-54 dependent transcriptional regulator [Cyclobacteriaceae bacterium]